MNLVLFYESLEKRKANILYVIHSYKTNEATNIPKYSSFKLNKLSHLKILYNFCMNS